MTPEQRKRVKCETCGSPVTVRTSGTTSSYEPVRQLDRGKVLALLDKELVIHNQSFGIPAYMAAPVVRMLEFIKDEINSGRLDVEEG